MNKINKIYSTTPLFKYKLTIKFFISIYKKFYNLIKIEK